jgi:hypothetical protein
MGRVTQRREVQYVGNPAMGFDMLGELVDRARAEGIAEAEHRHCSISYRSGGENGAASVTITVWWFE